MNIFKKIISKFSKTNKGKPVALTDFRLECAKKVALMLNKGEVAYYEIVGYEDTGKPIMKTVCCDKMPKEFIKEFGKFITYKYGCLPGTCDVYVYRITVQNEDGEIYELPWSSVKEKCKKAGIKHVPEILCDKSYNGDLRNPDGSATSIKDIVDILCEKHDLAEPIDPSHIREGVCVRIDNLETGKIKIFKNKTFAFKVLEGIIKNEEDYVDEEESQGEVGE